MFRCYKEAVQRKSTWPAEKQLITSRHPRHLPPISAPSLLLCLYAVLLGWWYTSVWAITPPLELGRMMDLAGRSSTLFPLVLLRCLLVVAQRCAPCCCAISRRAGVGPRLVSMRESIRREAVGQYTKCIGSLLQRASNSEQGICEQHRMMLLLLPRSCAPAPAAACLQSFMQRGAEHLAQNTLGVAVASLGNLIRVRRCGSCNALR